MTKLKLSSAWYTWSMRGWGPLVLNPSVKNPVTVVTGNPAPAAFCGFMANPNVEGSTGVIGSTATKLNRV